MDLPPPPIPFCTRHPNRETGRLCTRCAKPYCSECLAQAAVGSICVDCRKAAAPTPKQRAVYWNARQPILVTKVLIAINVAVYIWVLSGDFKYATSTGIGPHASDIALFGPFVHDGEYYRIISSGFLHFGLLHIAMNMFLLYQLGMLLENAIGRYKFTLLYFTSMVGGAAGALLLDPRIPSGGASGAVFGLMGAAVVALKLRGINPWRTGLGATLILNLVITFAIPGISKGGHLGGIAAGIICGWAMFVPSWKVKDAKLLAWAIPIAVLVGSFALCLAGAAQ